MDERPIDYSISRGSANLIVSLFENLRGTKATGTASAEDGLMKISMLQNICEDKALMTMKASWGDRWSIFDVMTVKEVDSADIVGDYLIVRAKGLECRFRIRD